MASYYPDELISEVISANNLVDVVGSYVKLKKSGNRYMGLCPFHGEKTPSFHVSEDKQLYHCFGCGEGGSVVQFIMKMENLDFVETIKFLAARAGINLPEGNERSSDGEFFKKKQAILEMYVSAARFYHSRLKSEEGKTALSYLAQRGLDAGTITRFGMGYAPNSYDALYNHFKEAGFSEQLMLDSGLIRKNDKTGKLYDFFRDRVMIPIFDIRGNVIAFGGRTMVKADKMKYLNSTDSIVFNKSKTLYALNFAKKNCADRIIMVEGYMDVISLHKYGFTNTVAGLGTAFTREHAKLLSRYTREVVLCYDSDEPGQKATLAALEILSDTDLKIKVLTIPGAKDPDEFLKAKGGAKFQSLLDSAPNHVLYKIGRLKQQYNIDNTEQKIELVTKMAAVFAEVKNDIEREAYVKEASLETGISEEAIFSEIKKTGLSAPSRKAPTHSFKTAAERDDKTDFRTEASLLSLMCSDVPVWKKMRGRLNADFFENRKLAPVTAAVFAYSAEDMPPDFSLIVSKAGAENVSELCGIVSSQQQVEDPIKAAEQMVKKLEDQKQKRLIESAAAEGDLATLADMIKNLKK